MSRRDLHQVQEVSINTNTIIIGSFVFAIIFFTIGAMWRYYIPMGI